MLRGGIMLSMLPYSKLPDTEKTKVEHAKKIPDGDTLRNINSHEYLLNIFYAIDEVMKNNPRFVIPDKFYPLDALYNDFKLDENIRNYNPRFPYGDYYSKIIQAMDMEDNTFKKHLEAKERELKAAQEKKREAEEAENTQGLSETEIKAPTPGIETPAGFVKKLETEISTLRAIYAAGVKTIFANPNQGLERTAAMIDPILKTTSHTSEDIQKKVTLRMKGKRKLFTSTINKTTPQKMGSWLGRAVDTFSSTSKSQLTTNMASIRTYGYKERKNADGKEEHRTDLSLELRFGTMGQFHESKARASPLFKKFLDVQKEERKNHPPASLHTRITHVYFNNLAQDRKDKEGQWEAQRTAQLHALEGDHDNVAVITLPADKGLFDHHLIQNHDQAIPSIQAFEKILAIANGTSTLDIKDFYISPEIKQLLYDYDKDNEQIILENLLHASFKKLGIDINQTMSPAEFQAVYFHFMKYELPNFILEKLQPVSFNMSCKDAIDRGGVSSAYYNLIKSLEQKPPQPLSQDEFYCALHAAPTLVKGRGMNDHSKLIWNAVDKYIDGAKKCSIPPWLEEWRKKHAPLGSKVQLCTSLENYIEKNKPKESKHRMKFFEKSIFSNFDNKTKYLAAQKFMNLIQNTPYEAFTEEEKLALHEGSLGKIVEKMANSGWTHPQIQVDALVSIATSKL